MPGTASSHLTSRATMSEIILETIKNNNMICQKHSICLDNSVICLLCLLSKFDKNHNHILHSSYPSMFCHTEFKEKITIISHFPMALVDTLLYWCTILIFWNTKCILNIWHFVLRELTKIIPYFDRRVQLHDVVCVNPQSAQSFRWI